jgi:hypothetical protein
MENQALDLTAYETQREDIACRIVVNLVSAGVISVADLSIRKLIEPLPMRELLELLCTSHEAKEQYGLPLVYRMSGIMN